jgi:uncharacterized protein
MDKTLWYASGLQFQCSQCGNCCTGSPGFVWVNQQEIEALAEAIGEEVDAFEDKYVRKIGIRKSLREFPNGDCVFFDTAARSCSVYDFRPRQCRTWPFWDSNLRKPEEWVRTCEICPGSGTGRLYQLEEIEKDRQVMRI